MPPTSPDKSIGHPAWGLWIAVLALLLLLSGWLIYRHFVALREHAAQQAELDLLTTRGGQLEKELSSVLPEDRPVCKVGETLSELPTGSAPTPAPSAGLAATAAESPKGAGSLNPLSKQVLAKRLEDATALVLGRAGNGLSMGSGFFVAENLLVTNRHVIDGVTGGRVFLVSKSLRSVRQGTVLGATRGSDPGAPDFALVRLEHGTAPGTLDVSDMVAKLAEIVSAGYPAIVVEGDASFARLIKGDLSAAPDLNLTTGAVQSLQDGAGKVPLIVHTATIAKGNSGGPLVDACGRAVGVNTFVSVDQAQSAKVHYAISANVMTAFLKSQGVSLRTDSRPCEPAK